MNIFDADKKCTDGDIKHGSAGSTRSAKYPWIYWENKWHRICGHHLRNNEVGATLICKKLGYDSGKVKNKGKGNSETDMFRIGQCNEGDSLTKCTGGCNDYKVGGQCSETLENCTKGELARMAISCSGGSDHYTASCKGKDIHQI